MMKDYYTILDVDRNASDVDLKKAFRTLAHIHHPDKGGDVDKFKEINEAYQVLSDKDRRTQYDRFGSVGGGTDGGFRQSGAYQNRYSHADINNMNAQFYSQFAKNGGKAMLFWQIAKKVPVLVWVVALPFMVFIALVGIVFFLVFGSIKKSSRVM